MVPSLANKRSCLDVSLVMNLVEGAQHLHSMGLVHRDIKPGNVLVVDADGPGCHAELADFGFARGELYDA